MTIIHEAITFAICAKKPGLAGLLGALRVGADYSGAAPVGNGYGDAGIGATLLACSGTERAAGAFVAATLAEPACGLRTDVRGLAGAPSAGCALMNVRSMVTVWLVTTPAIYVAFFW